MPRMLCGRTLLFGLILAASLGVPAANAGVVEIILTNGGVAFGEVFEGQSVVFDLTLFNGSLETIFQPGPATIANGIDFDEGDRNDEVFMTAVVNNNCRNTPQLLTGVGCTFGLEVFSRDLKPAPPADHADWLVRVGAFYNVIDPVTLGMETEFVTLDGTRVRVHDPFDLPEPSYLPIIGSVLVGIALLTYKTSVRKSTE